MKLLTWNVWFGEVQIRERATALVREIMRRNCEVVALQEITPPLRGFIERNLPHYELHGGDSMFGYDSMIMTRIGVASLDIVELPSDMGRRLIAVQLANGLLVATVHLESTAGGERARVAQLKLIDPWIAAKSPDAVFVGDMNFDDFAAREADALDDSFVDVWPALRPREPGYTVDSKVNTMRWGKVQKRIDRVFLRSPRWEARAIELVGTTAIDATGTFTSDHFGLEVILEPCS